MTWEPLSLHISYETEEALYDCACSYDKQTSLFLEIDNARLPMSSTWRMITSPWIIHLI